MKGIWVITTLYPPLFTLYLPLVSGVGQDLALGGPLVLGEAVEGYGGPEVGVVGGAARL